MSLPLKRVITSCLLINYLINYEGGIIRRLPMLHIFVSNIINRYNCLYINIKSTNYLLALHKYKHITCAFNAKLYKQMISLPERHYLNKNLFIKPFKPILAVHIVFFCTNSFIVTLQKKMQMHICTLIYTETKCKIDFVKKTFLLRNLKTVHQVIK